MRGLILTLLILPGFIFGEINWSGKAGDQFSVEISLSSQKLSLDQLLFVSVTLIFPENYVVDSDNLRINLLKFAGFSEPPFSLLSEKEEEIKGGKKITFTLDPLNDGIHFLSLYDIQFKPREEKTGTPVSIISNIFEIETIMPEINPEFRGIVYPLLPLTKRFPLSLSSDNRIDLLQNLESQEKENLRNEKVMREKTFPLPPVMGVFVFIILLLIARMQPKKEPDLGKFRKKQIISSKKKALNSLRTLKEKELPSLKAFDSYFTAMSETVRKYIEEIYQIKATTTTTTEFLELIAKSPAFDDKTKELLRKFLNSSDKVKFAGYTPSEEECQSAFQIAKLLVEYKHDSEVNKTNHKGEALS